MDGLQSADIRAAVAAGIIDEGQAASLGALSEARKGYRVAMSADDEPFELFRGFSEIFVALGLSLTGAGIWAVAGIMTETLIVPAAVGGALSWLLAEYFTRRRRMILPSILLSIGWAIAAATLALHLVPDLDAPNPRPAYALVALAGFAGALAFYWRFRTPFSLFVAALSAFGAMLLGAGMIDPAGLEAVGDHGPQALFDIRRSGGVALAALAFGLVAFALAMAFDLRDPHRVSRLSACGFWLHLIAAPAIVNTVLLTLFNLDAVGALGAMLALIAALTLVALVIDRRSFLVSALLYLGLLLSMAVEGVDEPALWAAVPLILGLFITALGAGWTRARVAVMRALPDFPGKRRLPPYVEGGA